MFDETSSGIETAAVHNGETDDDLGIETGDVLADPPGHTSRDAVPGDPGHGYKYARFGTPTRDSLETRLAELTGGDHATAFSSGTAAIATAGLTLTHPGDHIVAFESVYGGTRLLFKDLFWSKFGITVDYRSPRSPPSTTSRSASTTRSRRRASTSRSTSGRPGRPQHDQVPQPPQRLDRWRGGLQRRRNRRPDFLPPRVRPRESDPAVRRVSVALRGTKPPLRTQQHAENAQRVAEYLSDHPAVREVNYPGLETNPQHELARRQIQGFGGVVSFELDATEAKTGGVLERLAVFTIAVSLGGVESLVDHPWSMSASFVSPEERRAAGISESLVRTPIGIENPDDLVQDLEQALP